MRSSVFSDRQAQKNKSIPRGVFFLCSREECSILCSREESNLHRKLRKLASYPLKDESKAGIAFIFKPFMGQRQMARFTKDGYNSYIWQVNT